MANKSVRLLHTVKYNGVYYSPPAVLEVDADTADMLCKPQEGGKQAATPVNFIYAVGGVPKTAATGSSAPKEPPADEDADDGKGDKGKGKGKKDK